MRLPHHPADQALLWNQPEWSAPENLTLAAPWATEAEGTIPAKHGGRLFGANVSPALSWSGVPEDARGLLLVFQLFAVAQPLTLTPGFRLRDVRREPLPLLGRAQLVGLYQNE